MARSPKFDDNIEEEGHDAADAAPPVAIEPVRADPEPDLPRRLRAARFRQQVKANRGY